MTCFIYVFIIIKSIVIKFLSFFFQMYIYSSDPVHIQMLFTYKCGSIQMLFNTNAVHIQMLFTYKCCSHTISITG